MSDDDLITLPATIPAYSLSYKRWGLVDVDTIDKIQWKDGIYDMLQMESEQKEMVRGIIESHHASSSSFDDFIPGKGRGLVFLLHGPPGCGKTLTAGMTFRPRLSEYFLTLTESAAETLHRPLYYVSGAELGLIDIFNYRNNSIEDQLELIFKRIARWEAILLFDEAESFVASRDQQSGDGRKHALTSILLRMLEYQSGIVFLTTNRLSDFDTALFSRVHVTLKFEQLSAESCEFIWKRMAMQTEHSLSEEDFKALSRIPLDGRTIKNILRVASLQVQLRLRRESAGDKRLQMKDVKKVLRYTVGSGGNELVAERLKEFYS
jgi:SpoVK/Ycf46/Vps4 family AAA+-type ATPase